MSDLRLGYVTQWFPPEPVAAPVWIAQAMRRQGWEVSVLTGLPNYPDGVVHPGYRKRRTTRDVIDGFEVIRAPLYASHDRSAAKRMANYLTWATCACAVRRSPLAAVDATLVYSSPATAALPAMAARARWGVPYVLLVQDIWPDSIFASGFLEQGRSRRLAERSVSALTTRAYAQSAAVAVISPGMKDLLVSRGVPAEKISVVFNWADESAFRPTAPDPAFRAGIGLGTDDFLLMYAGAHGPAQALDHVLEAADQLRDRTDIHFALVGAGVSKQALKARAVQLGLDRVHFVASVPLSEMPRVLPAADAHLVSLADRDLFRITMPSKTQSLMAAGQPIIAVAPGDTARVVREAGAGLTVTPGNPVGLADAILEMAAMSPDQRRAFGKAGLAAYQRDMCEAVGASTLSQLLRDAADERGRA